MQPSEVSAGIEHFNKARSVDVIIVARGGGSAEDLAAFNHEGLARTIAGSELPVISAVGHETDFTIADFVADLRAPTPSAAAELVIRSRQEVEEQSEGLRQRLARAMQYQLLIRKQALTELAQHGAFRRITDLINQRQQRLDDLLYRAERAERRVLEQHRQGWHTAAAAVRHYDLRRMLAGVKKELDAYGAALHGAVRAAVLAHRSRLERLTAGLAALSPLSILDRGYALIFNASGELVKDAAQVCAGEEISAKLARGEIAVTVRKTTS